MQKSEKKILFLPSWYPSQVHSTLGNFIQKHVEVASQIAEVTVLYAISSDEHRKLEIVDEERNGVRTCIVYYPKTTIGFQVYAAYLKKNKYLEALKKGYQYINSDFDLVHLNVAFPAGMFARWLKRKYKTPYVITEHWTGYLDVKETYRKLPPFIKSWYRKIFRGAKKVSVVSDYLGEALKRHRLLSDYKVLNNVVQEGYFYPKKEQKEKSKIQFLHVSTFDDNQKNISGMLRCFSKLSKDFLLYIITETEEKVVIDKLKEFNIPKENFKIESKVSSERVGEVMRDSDALVLFSNYETFSIVLAESWTSGIPAIYSECGGLTDINNPTIGCQIPRQNEEKLLEVLENFTPSNYKVEEITDFAKQYSVEGIKEVLSEIYELEK